MTFSLLLWDVVEPVGFVVITYLLYKIYRVQKKIYRTQKKMMEETDELGEEIVEI